MDCVPYKFMCDLGKLLSPWLPFLHNLEYPTVLWKEAFGEAKKKTLLVYFTLVVDINGGWRYNFDRKSLEKLQEEMAEKNANVKVIQIIVRNPGPRDVIHHYHHGLIPSTRNFYPTSQEDFIGRLLPFVSQRLIMTPHLDLLGLDLCEKRAVTEQQKQSTHLVDVLVKAIRYHPYFKTLDLCYTKSLEDFTLENFTGARELTLKGDWSFAIEKPLKEAFKSGKIIKLLFADGPVMTFDNEWANLVINRYKETKGVQRFVVEGKEGLRYETFKRKLTDFTLTTRGEGIQNYSLPNHEGEICIERVNGNYKFAIYCQSCFTRRPGCICSGYWRDEY
ncbi:hypothetical protein L596_006612 [Steinernema carpocapsae]|uniref:Uncharacterized protein n=1 Tax=Steinernema carpocapsae TaxID=34508 RepID=A0A4U8V5C6_STECR|nr:hypothetical protein L596_006612 [Steinernema carpocapsae]